MSQNVSIVLQKSRQAAGVVSGSPKGVVGVRDGAAIKALPTSAGTASVYSSISPLELCLADIKNNAVPAGTADWDLWSAGAVAVKTIQQAVLPANCVAIVVASGTWTLEVMQ